MSKKQFWLRIFAPGIVLLALLLFFLAIQWATHGCPEDSTCAYVNRIAENWESEMGQLLVQWALFILCGAMFLVPALEKYGVIRVVRERKEADE